MSSTGGPLHSSDYMLAFFSPLSRNLYGSRVFRDVCMFRKFIGNFSESSDVAADCSSELLSSSKVHTGYAFNVVNAKVVIILPLNHHQLLIDLLKIFSHFAICSSLMRGEFVPFTKFPTPCYPCSILCIIFEFHHSCNWIRFHNCCERFTHLVAVLRH